MSVLTPRCHYELDHGWLTPEHLRDCRDSSCPGCRPCPEAHCALRGKCASHVDPAAGIYTCPRCIGRVRTDLAAIVDLYAVEMPREAADAGVESEAFNLLGPAASVEQVDARRRMTDRDRGWCDWPRPVDDPHHPYVVLGSWDLALREAYGPQTDLFITVATAADYLTGLLAGPFPHTREFEDFAHAIARCRAHLEQVAHDSRVPEEGRQCPRCTEERGDGPRLRKRYAKGIDEKTMRGENDTWHCPAESAHWWTERDYRDRVAVDYVQHASELPAAELAERIGVPLSRIRKWAARVWDEGAKAYRAPLLVSRRRGADGRKLYPVERALQLAEDQCSLRLSAKRCETL